MDGARRDVSLVSPQEYCSGSTDEEDTSWTDSSYSNESLIALSTYPPRSNHATRYKPSQNTYATSFLDNRTIYNDDLMYGCDYGSIERDLLERNRHFHRGLLSSVRYDYDHFPPYRDKGHGGIVENVVDKCNIVTSRFSYYFKRKLACGDTEQTPLLPRRDERFPQPGNSQINEPRHSLNSGNARFEEEYQAPPGWKGTEYLEWLGLLGHSKSPDDCRSPRASQSEGYSSFRDGHSVWELKSSLTPLTGRRQSAADGVSHLIARKQEICPDAGMTLSLRLGLTV